MSYVLPFRLILTLFTLPSSAALFSSYSVGANFPLPLDHSCMLTSDRLASPTLGVESSIESDQTSPQSDLFCSRNGEKPNFCQIRLMACFGAHGNGSNPRESVYEQSSVIQPVKHRRQRSSNGKLHTIKVQVKEEDNQSIASTGHLEVVVRERIAYTDRLRGRPLSIER